MVEGISEANVNVDIDIIRFTGAAYYDFNLLERFARIRSYISTIRKQSEHVVGSLVDTFNGSPFIPQ